MKVSQTANLGNSQKGISGSIRYAVFDTLGSETVSSTWQGISTQADGKLKKRKSKWFSIKMITPQK